MKPGADGWQEALFRCEAERPYVDRITGQEDHEPGDNHFRSSHPEKRIKPTNFTPGDFDAQHVERDEDRPANGKQIAAKVALCTLAAALGEQARTNDRDNNGDHPIAGQLLF